jgi:hypothetical protein
MPGRATDSDTQPAGFVERSTAEEQAAMLVAAAGRIRQAAGLELTPDHTTRLPTVWVFRMVYLLLGVATTGGVLMLNLRFVSREEADKTYVKRELFDDLRANTKQTADAVKSIEGNLDEIRKTLALLAARGEKDIMQDDRIKRIEERMDRDRK